MKKRILTVIFCVVLVMSATPMNIYADQSKEVESTQNIVTEDTLFNKILNSESISEMYIEILDAMNNMPEELNSLTMNEIEEIRIKMKEIDPELDDEDTEDMLDTLAILLNGEGTSEEKINVLASATIKTNAVWKGSVLTDTNTEWTFENGTVITLNGPITIPNGKTLKIKGWGAFARSSTNKTWLFIVENGGKLIIEGSSESKPFTIDGKNVIANTGMISSAGILNMKNTVVQNGKNRSVDEKKGTPNGAGGGFVVTATGSLQMENCVVTKNTASVNAGGFISYGSANIKNSTISYNRAMSTETGAGVVNAGRGGGFYLSGAAAKGVFENVRVTQNAAMYYGGGGQVSGGASLTIKGDTIFDYNTSVLQGAGALHITGSAMFTMNDGVIENNTAQTVGGAIHSSYTCVLNLNSGKILNNVANGRAGGINVNTGGTITLGEGLEISGNKVYNKAAGSAANVDSTGDSWSNVKYEGAKNNNGYGGAVCLDSAECNVEGAVIKDNYAEVGGGAIALVMLNASVWEHISDLKCVNFAMTSGEISGNTTDGSGAGVYLMSNKIEESLHFYYDNNSDSDKTYEGAVEKLSSKDLLTDIPIARISGGTISDNIAEDKGGGLYLDMNTKFIISETGDLSRNKATNGAGVYIASGTAEILGGTMTENKASSNGGALFVAGTVMMSDGTINKNEAVENGGALYISGGDFTMTSGTMTENKATGKTSNGGGAYVIGGDVVIGVKDCNGSGTNHIVEPKDKSHPVVKNNSATDSGGGIALIGDGNLTMYCGNITENSATNKGRGLNIYMEKGTFDYYNGSVGALVDPDLVIVGGKLKNHKLGTEDVQLNYYHCNIKDHTINHTNALETKQAIATLDSWFNLPDGEKYWTAESGYRFFGWTFNGPESENAKNHVRAKNEYYPLGTPIQVEDKYDETADANMHLYALWAPEVSDITYVGSVVNGVYEDETLVMSGNPNTYTFSVASNIVTLNAPTKPGYTFEGWYIYQNEGQNANWGYDHNPVYIKGTSESEKSYTTLDYTKLKFLEADNEDGSYELEMGTTNFGDITLIAKFEEAFADIEIRKIVNGSLDSAQTFMFQVTGQPDKVDSAKIDMKVTISGQGEIFIKHLPVGTYEVKELTAWSSQFGDVSVQKGTEASDKGKVVSVTLPKADIKEVITFTNTRTDDKWLIGNSYCENWFANTGIVKNRIKQ